MFLLKLALMNIGRNPRRSVITVAAVGIGLAALIFLWGFHDGTAAQMRRNVCRLFTGHVQIHEQGFQKNLAIDKTLSRRETLLQRVMAEPEVVAVSERVKCEALVGTSEKSRGILLIGMDPQKEPEVTDLRKHIVQGSFIRGNRDVLLGTRLAERLNVKAGEKLVVMTQAVDGTMAGYSYTISGVFHTGSQQVDELTAYISLDSAQELLSLDNETHEMVIRLRDLEDIPSFMEKTKALAQEGNYEISTWNEIVPEPEMWVKWYSVIMNTIFTVVMVVIGVGIMNTVLMSVFERTRELGVMLAIGTKPSQIVSLVVLETLVLEFLGIILGIFLGYALVFYFSKAGISFKEVEQALSQSYVSSVTYTQVETSHVIQSILTLLGICTFIGIYPAWKAGRLEPIKAIYHS